MFVPIHIKPSREDMELEVEQANMRNLKIKNIKKRIAGDDSILLDTQKIRFLVARLLELPRFFQFY